MEDGDKSSHSCPCCSDCEAGWEPIEAGSSLVCKNCGYVKIGSGALLPEAEAIALTEGGGKGKYSSSAQPSFRVKRLKKSASSSSSSAAVSGAGFFELPRKVLNVIDSLGFSDSASFKGRVQELANVLYGKRLFTRKKRLAQLFLYSCIYASARFCKKPITLKEISGLVPCSPQALGRTFNRLKVICGWTLELNVPSDFVERLLSSLMPLERKEAEFWSLCKKVNLVLRLGTDQSWITSGRQPITIAGAAIVTVLLCIENPPIEGISLKAGKKAREMQVISLISSKCMVSPLVLKDRLKELNHCIREKIISAYPSTLPSSKVIRQKNWRLWLEPPAFFENLCQDRELILFLGAVEGLPACMEDEQKLLDRRRALIIQGYTSSTPKERDSERIEWIQKMKESFSTEEILTQWNLFPDLSPHDNGDKEVDEGFESEIEQYLRSDDEIKELLKLFNESER